MFNIHPPTLVSRILCFGVVLWSAALAAGSIKVPDGWQATQEGNQWVLRPSGLKSGQVFKLVVFRDVDLQEKDLQTYFKQFLAQNGPEHGKVLQQGGIEAQGQFLTASVAVQSQGNTLVLFYSAFEAGAGRGQVALVMTSQDQELTSKYAPVAGDILGSVVALYQVQSSALASADLPAGAKVGGKIQGGLYTCTQHFTTIEPGKFSLSLYDNGEWRIGDKNGKVGYNPRTGQIDISVLLNLYNSNYDPDKVTVYYRDINNKPSIYSNVSLTPITCAYAGKTQQPSPEEEAKKKAEKEAQEAEARRFKWYTAPGKGLQFKDIEGIYLHYRSQYNSYSMLYDYVEEYNLLLKDGWMYGNLVVTPADLDVKASRKNEPKNWFKWKRQGEDIVYLDDGEWRKLEGTKVIPAKPGEKIQGSFLFLANNSNMVTGGSVYKEYFHFDRKGGYAISSTSSLYASGMPGYSGSSTTYTDSSGSSSSFAAGTPNGFAGGGSENQTGNPDLAGTYTLDGYTLVLKTRSGKTVRKLFFFPSNKKDQVVIDGVTYWIPSD
ncbi:hypothetical protein [Deinococcus cellulosilyticus]|uniref:Uncharacterized protein n=1 Tax=Deinococcus cellulosilyticus (strain DSM 18568 / NBRC 106333 / KACC 11606 / 5516J-15) TaxID=1223518 RepID=A0A511MXT6_DEIC1|nr:hypothetical protein [Deinococcus cellulosilyticus]GEM44946.1 hypothetical protein DC3_05810 [Deinococcus cellulosilyticus NBRC 106333 = KACC 11606]